MEKEAKKKEYKYPSSYYKKQFALLPELSDRATYSITSWWEQILLVASSIAAILVSLHTKSEFHLYTRLAFLIAVASLVLGVLLVSIVLFHYKQVHEKARQAFLQEIKNAIQEDREINGVGCALPKRLKVFETIAYVLLILSLVMMIVYIVLQDFIE